jgi:hypothetical protein
MVRYYSDAQEDDRGSPRTVRPTRTSITAGIEGTVRPADQRPFARTPTDARPTLAAKVNISDTLDVVDTSAARRAKAAYPWCWQPGQSGNPGGLSSFYWKIGRLARDPSPDAMKRLIDLLRQERLR